MSKITFAVYLLISPAVTTGKYSPECRSHSMPEDQDKNGEFAFPPGHFFSPIPSIEEIKLREEYIFDQWPEALHGIDMRVREQLALLEEFREILRGVSV